MGRDLCRCRLHYDRANSKNMKLHFFFLLWIMIYDFYGLPILGHVLLKDYIILEK